MAWLWSLGQRLEHLVLTRREPFDRLPVHPFLPRRRPASRSRSASSSAASSASPARTRRTVSTIYTDGLVAGAGGPAVDGTCHVATIEGRAQHERLSARAGRAQVPDEVAAVAVRQPEVDHRHIDVMEELGGLRQVDA